MTPEQKRNLAIERELLELAQVVDKFESVVLEARDCARLCRESYNRLRAVQAESELLDNAIERLDSLRAARPGSLNAAIVDIATTRVCGVTDNNETE